MNTAHLKNIQPEPIVEYIRQLVQIPSPTGFTHHIQDFLLENARSKKIACSQKKKGAVLYAFEKDPRSKRIMLCCHVDTLGAMVKNIQKEKIKIAPIGSYPALYAIGNYCTIHTHDGKTYSGTVLPDNPSTHVSKSVRELVPDFDNIYVRPDLRLKNERDTLRKYISNGDYISFDPCFSFVEDFLKSRHLDDKASAGILLYLADLIGQQEDRCPHNLYLYFNVTEETGQGIPMDAVDEMIVVDMGCIGEGLEGDEFSVSICPKDSSGPYHYELTRRFIALAQKNRVDHKVDVFPFYGSDGSSALSSGKDVKVALIGPGVHASHGYERTHSQGLLNTLKLLLLYCEGMG